MVVALQDARVAQALRLAVTPEEAQRSHLEAELLRPEFVNACRNVFVGTGVWSALGSATSADALRIALEHLLAEPYILASLAPGLRRRIRPRTAIGVYQIDPEAVRTLAQEIYAAFADTSRALFAGERNRKTPKALAATGRKRQRPILIKIAAEDLAYTEWYIEQLEQVDHQDSVQEQIELAKRHLDVHNLSEVAWESLFEELRKIYMPKDEETSCLTLRTWYGNVIDVLNKEIRESKAYQDARLKLFGVNIIPHHQPQDSDGPANYEDEGSSSESDQ